MQTPVIPAHAGIGRIPAAETIERVMHERVDTAPPLPPDLRDLDGKDLHYGSTELSSESDILGV